MQTSPPTQAFHDSFGQPYSVAPPDEEAVRRAYGPGVGLPSERWKLDQQAQLVGAVTLVLAGICLLATVVLVLGAWLPVWLVTFGLSVALTALGLALFASVARSQSRGVSASRSASAFPTQLATPAPTHAVRAEAIEEIDPKDVESVRAPELASEGFGQRRLTPHPIVAAVTADNDSDTDSDPEMDDLKTRPIGDGPAARPSRKPLRAEMPSSASFNH